MAIQFCVVLMGHGGLNSGSRVSPRPLRFDNACRVFWTGYRSTLHRHCGKQRQVSPYFPKMNRAAIRGVGVAAVLVGVAVGIYMSLLYSIWFLAFVFLGGLFALFYPIEKPKWLHSYAGFGVAWGFIPVLASYYIQALRIDLVGLGLAVFLGITVVEMHHMAVLTNEKEYAPETNKNARLLLKIHRAAAYAIGLILLISRLV